MLRVALATLGCKVNRADGQALLGRLGDRVSLVPFQAEADVYIVNTCTVTAAADRQSRQLAYRARRRNPAARVVLTGCLARVSPEQAGRIPGVDRAFSLAEHAGLLAYLEGLRPGASSSPCQVGPERRRARPFLKVQDGCDAACSYCIVPAARGPSRSVGSDEIVTALGRLAADGPGEVVLSGIHLGAYGRDLDPETTLAALIRRCAALGPRLRLSSVEPHEVDAELCALLETEPALCPHLHLPIQSGSDAVLAAMNRPYRAAEVRLLLDRLRARRADLALGADLIAGFPGESEADAEASLALVEASPLSHLHVFPFSARPGTPAAARRDQVPGEVRRARARLLRQAGQTKLAAFAAAQLGQVREILVESVGPDGRVRGLSDNYLRVELAAPVAAALRPGSRVRGLVEECRGTLLLARAAR